MVSGMSYETTTSPPTAEQRRSIRRLVILTAAMLAAFAAVVWNAGVAVGGDLSEWTSTSILPTTTTVEQGGTTVPQGGPTTTIESGQPTTTLESGQPTTTLESGQPTTTLESGQPTTTLESEQPTTTLESEQPTTTLESGQPTTTRESEQPTTTLESEQPTTTTDCVGLCAPAVVTDRPERDPEVLNVCLSHAEPPTEALPVGEYVVDYAQPTWWGSTRWTFEPCRPIDPTTGFDVPTAIGDPIAEPVGVPAPSGQLPETGNGWTIAFAATVLLGLGALFVLLARRDDEPELS
jgi:LPXTG-motif cell wall-anchored protein